MKRLPALPVTVLTHLLGVLVMGTSCGPPGDAPTTASTGALSAAKDQSEQDAGASKLDVAQVGRAVVLLRTFSADGTPVALGSGFIVDDGRVVTNAHVVQNAEYVEAYDSEGRLLGTADHAVSISPRTDIAVLPPVPNRPGTLRLAEAEPDVGESVLVIGAPQGLTHTVSNGIISAHREVDGTRLLQLTAPISSGSSGGPVLNARGEVIGVSVFQLAEGQNLNFAVPAGAVRAVLGSAPGHHAFAKAPPKTSQAPSHRRAPRTREAATTGTHGDPEAQGQSAQNLRWVLVGESDVGATRVDRTSVRMAPGGRVLARDRTSYNEWRYEGGHTFNHALFLREFDCGARRTRVLSFTAYADSKPVATENDPWPWDEWKPGTVGQAQGEFVCAEALARK